MSCSVLVCLISLCSIHNLPAQTSNLLKLWYRHPARLWVEALPVGNGRLGAMVYGDPYEEKIQLNENTVWAGQPNRNDNPEAREALPQVRKLIFEGRYKEAQDLVNQKFISKVSNGMPYQTVGDLHLMFPGHEDYSDYYRELDIAKAVQTTRYTALGVHYETKVFASFVGQVIIVRMTADKSGSINFTATMDRPASFAISTKGNSELILSGVTSDRDSIKGKVRFQAHVKILVEGGSVSAADTALSVNDADTATIYISIASSFKKYDDISADAGARADQYLQNALKRSLRMPCAKTLSRIRNTSIVSTLTWE